MEPPSAEPPAPLTPRPDRWATLGLVVVMAAFAWFVKVHFVPAIIAPDDNGYFAQGSLIAQTGKTWFTAESDVQFIGLHWLLTPDGKYVSRYPPGEALVIAALYAAFGFRVSLLAVPLMALLALWCTFLIARRLTSAWWAVACTAFLAVNPAFLNHALLGDSHIFVTAVLAAGVALLGRWQDRGRPVDAFLAGLVLGCVPTVRYPDAVVAVGVLAFFVASVRRFPGMPRHLGAAALGAALPILALAVRNQVVMGAFWRTGYTLSAEQSAFGWGFFKDHVAVYLRSLSGEGLRSLFALGLLGSLWMVSVRKHRAMGVLLLLTTTPVLLLYMSYYWDGGVPGTSRFMLLTFPLYLAAATWALAEATALAPRYVRVAAPLVVLGLQLASTAGESLRLAEQQRRQKTVLADVTAELERVTPPGSLVVTEGDLLQHLDFVRRWRLADEALAKGVPTGLALGLVPPQKRVQTPNAVQELKATLLNEKLGTTAEERRAHVLAALRAWAKGEKLYLVTPERTLLTGIAAGTLPSDLDVLARVKLPPLPSGPWLDLRPPPPGGVPLPDPTENGGDFLIAAWTLR